MTGLNRHTLDPAADGEEEEMVENSMVPDFGTAPQSIALRFTRKMLGG